MASDSIAPGAPPQSSNTLSNGVQSSIHSSPQEPDEKRLNDIQESPQNESTVQNALLDKAEAVTTNKPRHEPLAARIFTNGWGGELLAWIIAAMAFAAIAGILVTFDQRALPQWPYQINLNTFISVFSQISSTALLGPLVECISQLKWLWFTRRSQPLDDFQSFDSASRGPWPSFLLIWKTRAR
jgi:Protein of unknown function (DUF3176)